MESYFHAAPFLRFMQLLLNQNGGAVQSEKKGGLPIKIMKFLLTGAAAGLLNGLFGAGGGMVVVPMLHKDGLPEERAHATSIAVILPLSALSSVLYLSLGHIGLSDALWFIPLGLAGAVLGGWILPRIQTVWLHRIFGALVLYSAVRLLLQ